MTDQGIHTGIAQKIQVPGWIPFFEEYSAMLEANYNTTEWRDLSSDERALAVAAYRLKRHIALHEADAREIKAQLESKGRR